MKGISLTIPLEGGPLRRAADMLTRLAEDTDESPSTFTEFTDKVVNGMAVGLGVTAEELMAPVVPEVPVVPAVAEVPVVPIVPAAETAEVLGDAGLDSKGLPWDGRIYAASKTTLAKTGAWKLKRGVKPEFVAQVEAELLASMGTATVVPEVPVVETPVVPVVPEVPVVPVVPAAEVVTFETICAKVTARANAQLLQPTDIPGVLAPHGLTDLAGLAKRADLFVAVNTALDTLWATTPV